MKAKGFTLMELLLAMSLMGMVLATGGRLYMHLQSRLLQYESQLRTQEQQLIAKQCFQQDLMRSIAVESLSDSSICLRYTPSTPPICYIQQDSLMLRVRSAGTDSLAALPMHKLQWQARWLVGRKLGGSRE